MTFFYIAQNDTIPYDRTEHEKTAQSTPKNTRRHKITLHDTPQTIQVPLLLSPPLCSPPPQPTSPTASITTTPVPQCPTHFHNHYDTTFHLPTTLTTISHLHCSHHPLVRNLMLLWFAFASFHDLF